MQTSLLVKSPGEDLFLRIVLKAFQALASLPSALPWARPRLGKACWPSKTVFKGFKFMERHIYYAFQKQPKAIWETSVKACWRMLKQFWSSLKHFQAFCEISWSDTLNFPSCKLKQLWSKQLWSNFEAILKQCLTIVEAILEQFWSMFIYVWSVSRITLKKYWSTLN